MIMVTANHPLLVDDKPFPVLPFGIMTAALVLLAALYTSHMTLREKGLVMNTERAFYQSPTAHEIVVGGINFKVPSSFVRFGEQQRSGVLPRVDMALAWPSLAPLGDPEIFRTTPREKIILVGLSDGGEPLDTTDLLGSVYREVFVGPVETAAHGLVTRQLDPQAGYGDDRVVFDIQTGSGFAARCSGGDQTVWTTCYRDIILTNGLTVTLRFSPAILADWEELDPQLLGFLVGLAQNAQ
ncbi:MAG: hypothetical protein AAF986_08455 [Pseudomonadota bacterium]